MCVIFLDFDGVLNSEKYVRGREGLALDPAKMALLKEIVEATSAKIVLTTSWRSYWTQSESEGIGGQINAIFSDYGLQIWDKTPETPDNREAQIKSWLDSHPAVTNFVVLDDRLLSGDDLAGHFVKTSNYFGGLDASDVRKAIAILNG